MVDESAANMRIMEADVSKQGQAAIIAVQKNINPPTAAAAAPAPVTTAPVATAAPPPYS